MKVKIRNYQSIKLGEVEIKGLVGIVGANNSGKTAIMRAMRAFIMNGFGATDINQEESEGSVTIDAITLKRVPGTSSLIENGVEKGKLEGKTLFELTKVDDFLLINNEKIKNILPQFSFTKEKLFPFNLTDSQIYYLFSMMFDMSTLNKIFLYIKNKLKEDNDKLTYMKGKMDQILQSKTKTEKVIQKLPPIEMIEKMQNRYNIFKLLYKHRKIKESNINIKVNLFEYLYFIIKWKKIQELNTILNRLEHLYSLKQLKIIKELKVKLDNIVEVPIEYLILNRKLNVSSKLYSKLVNVLNIPIEYIMMNKQLVLSRVEMEKTNKNYNEVKFELNKYDICPLCERPM